MKKNGVSQETYKQFAGTTSEAAERASKKLADIALCLIRSPDFSPITIDAMKSFLSDIDALRETLKKMVSVSVNRGCTHFDEQKSKLVSGSLRINRQSGDIAAAAE